MTQTYGMVSPIIRPLGRMTQNIMATPIGGTMNAPQVSTVMPNPMTTPQVSTVMPNPTVNLGGNQSILNSLSTDPNVLFMNSNPGDLEIFVDKTNSNIEYDLMNQSFQFNRVAINSAQLQSVSPRRAVSTNRVNGNMLNIGDNTDIINIDNRLNLLTNRTDNILQHQSIDTAQKNNDISNQFFSLSTINLSNTRLSELVNTMSSVVNNFYSGASRNLSQMSSSPVRSNTLMNSFYSSR